MVNERYARVEAVYQDALDTPPEQRAELLDRACRGDHELRREVEALLSHYDAAPMTFLDHAAHALRHSPPVPERIGQYRILGVLGEGGMGIVYRAAQEHPRREVAVKVMRAGVFSERALQRFELETAILGRLKHPGIAQIHEAGLHEDPFGRRPFFAMELVEGPPVTAFATAEGLGIAQRLELVAEICDAVHHAHQRSLVHRDLKPANILVTRPDTSEGERSPDSGGRAMPKVLDFGVALATDSDIAATTMHTETGQLIGTLPYMSPEQLAGDVAAIDIRSDVYSLGVVLYELLCGRVPFDVTGKSIAAAARMISEEEPTPPGKVDRAMRGDLDTIARKALEKKPERRYQSASELAADLRRYLRHEPIAARPSTTVYQLSKFARRNRGLVAGLASAFVILIGGLVGTSFGLSQAMRARDAEAEHRAAAEESEQAAVVARDESEAVTRFLMDMLGAVSPEGRGSDVTVREALDQAASTVGQKLSGRPLIEARVRYAIGWSYFGLGIVDKAQEQMTEATAIFRREKGERDSDTLGALSTLGAIVSEKGNYSESEAHSRAALEVQRRVLGDEHPQTLISMDNLALALSDQGRYAEAEELLRRTLEASRRVLGQEHPGTLASMNNLGLAVYSQGNYVEAEQLQRQALEIRRHILGDDHRLTLDSMHNLANVLNALGHFTDAEELHRRALAGRRRVIGETHFLTLTSMDDLAKNLCDQKRFAEAEPLSRAALDGLRSTLGAEHPDTIETMQNLAVAIQNQGRFEEAQELLNASLEAANRTLGADHTLTLAALERVAALHLATGQLDEAQQSARRCLETRQRIQGEHPDTAKAMYLLARICLASGNDDEARTVARRAHQILQQTLGPDAVATREAAATLRSLEEAGNASAADK